MNNYFNKNLIIAILFLGISTFSNGQELNTFLSKINNYYSSIESYNIDATYNFYKGYTGNDNKYNYSGKLFKEGNITGVNILKNKILITPEAKLIIDKENKSLTYSKINKVPPEGKLIDIENYSKYYKINSIKEINNMTVCEMVLKPSITQSPYNKLIIHVDNKNYSILLQVLYFTSKLPFKDDKGNLENDEGRLEIVYTSNKKPLNNIPKIEDFLNIDANNNISANNTYSDYKIIDQTIK